MVLKRVFHGTKKFTSQIKKVRRRWNVFCIQLKTLLYVRQCYVIFAVLILDRSLYTASLLTEMKIPLLRRSAIKDTYPLIVLSPT